MAFWNRQQNYSGPNANAQPFAGNRRGGAWPNGFNQGFQRQGLLPFFGQQQQASYPGQHPMGFGGQQQAAFGGQQPQNFMQPPAGHGQQMPMMQPSAGQGQQMPMMQPSGGQGQQGGFAPQSPNQPQQNLFNTPLPDGVTMQPISPETLRQIQAGLPPTSPAPPSEGLSMPAVDMGSIPPIPTAGPSAPGNAIPMPTPMAAPSAPLAGNTGASSDQLKNFAQNERNGALFYQHLARIAPYDTYYNMLEGISKGCSKRKNSFHAMHQAVSSEGNWEPEESKINNRVRFREGLRLAITEESQMLKELAASLDETQDHATEKKFTRHIAEKMSDLHLLQMMLHSL